MLGERDSRTTEQLHFETNPRIKPVKDEGRCYGLGEMVQIRRQVSAPAAHNKVLRGSVTDYQREIQEFLKVRSFFILTYPQS